MGRPMLSRVNTRVTVTIWRKCNHYILIARKFSCLTRLSSQCLCLNSSQIRAKKWGIHILVANLWKRSNSNISNSSLKDIITTTSHSSSSSLAWSSNGSSSNLPTNTSSPTTIPNPQTTWNGNPRKNLPQNPPTLIFTAPSTTQTW